MLKNSCKRYQQMIIDIYYDEIKMNQEIKNHLETCENCREFYQELNEINIKLKELDEELPIEYMKIDNAFIKAEEISRKQTNTLSLIAFVILSTIILAFVTVLAFKGYMREILYLQAGMYLLMPFLLPLFIKVRLIKEGYDERN